MDEIWRIFFNYFRILIISSKLLHVHVRNVEELGRIVQESFRTSMKCQGFHRIVEDSFLTRARPDDRFSSFTSSPVEVVVGGIDALVELEYSTVVSMNSRI